MGETVDLTEESCHRWNDKGLERALQGVRMAAHRAHFPLAIAAAARG